MILFKPTYITPFLKWSGAVLITASVTTWITHYFNRPKLVIQLTDVAITSGQPTGSTNVRTPASLQEACRTHFWIPCFHSEYDEATYVADLHSARHSAKLVISDLQKLRSNMVRLITTNPSPETAKEAARFTWSHWRLLSYLIQYEVARTGSAVIPESTHKSTDDGAFLYVTEESDQTVLLMIDGLELSLTWSEEEPTRAHGKTIYAVIRNLFLGIAFAEQRILESLKAMCDQFLALEPQIRDLTNIMDAEIQRFGYWIVRLLVTNGGGYPVAIAPQARMYVQTDGLIVENPFNQKERIIGDRYVDLFLARERSFSAVTDYSDSSFPQNLPRYELSSEPVVVAPGGATTLQLMSMDAIQSSSDLELLLKAFRAESQNARIAIECLNTECSETAQGGILVSDIIQFRTSLGSTRYSNTIPW